MERNSTNCMNFIDCTPTLSLYISSQSSITYIYQYTMNILSVNSKTFADINYFFPITLAQNLARIKC